MILYFAHAEADFASFHLVAYTSRLAYKKLMSRKGRLNSAWKIRVMVLLFWETYCIHTVHLSIKVAQ